MLLYKQMMTDFASSFFPAGWNCNTSGGSMDTGGQSIYGNTFAKQFVHVSDVHHDRDWRGSCPFVNLRLCRSNQGETLT